MRDAIFVLIMRQLIFKTKEYFEICFELIWMRSLIVVRSASPSPPNRNKFIRKNFYNRTLAPHAKHANSKCIVPQKNRILNTHFECASYLCFAFSFSKSLRRLDAELCVLSDACSMKIGLNRINCYRNIWNKRKKQLNEHCCCLLPVCRKYVVLIALMFLRISFDSLISLCTRANVFFFFLWTKKNAIWWGVQ